MSSDAASGDVAEAHDVLREVAAILNAIGKRHAALASAGLYLAPRGAEAAHVAETKRRAIALRDALVRALEVSR